MNYFSYVVEHDYGLAPNPFGGYCSLAVCKPGIRGNQNLTIGDWIIGTGGKKLKRDNHIIYLMQISEKLTFNKYYKDIRFQYKKPIPNGSLVQIFGDNFYYKDDNTEKWTQDISAHSFKDKKKHIKTDTSSEVVLIANKFYYFGDMSVEIPDQLKLICKKGPGMKYKGLEETGDLFVEWVENSFELGIIGDPISWKEYDSVHNQYNLEI
ncbi:MAG: hypothetical protein CMF34_04780 [Leeuwenhoekiella sp.]|nr:hypothetical protein [Leeuwenhoekiella sp.]MBH11694.1 hypothetical protein [Leeuwenhoekiella sp.]HBO28302.1 hypothetical protein [Leeuwenhoekiella sp.]|tara:strand:- start:6052 stop:6678 length:627 start_codon:yes stop_codon:yes gene_type:complete